MSANNTFSLLNETEGSDTSYRIVHVSRPIHLLPGMDWTQTLIENFGEELDCVEEIVDEVKEVPIPVEVVDKKTTKKNKKVPVKKVEEDLDAIFEEMGVELNEDICEDNIQTQKTEPEKKKSGKKLSRKATSIIANETAQRRINKKKGKI